MNLKLLNDWADALEALELGGDPKEAGFNMNNWAKYKLPDTPALGCGTVCCALGLATAIPSWREAGILEHFAKTGNYFEADLPEISRMLEISFIDLDRIVMGYLYRIEDHIQEVTPGKVAKKIRQLDPSLQA